ncbi:hypothetical protein ACFLVF_03745 [Chloroflexota bacterium]
MITPESIEEGCLISMGLIPGTAPNSCYVGLVKSANKHGITMNPAKWDDLDGIGLSKKDVYIPWPNINSMLICTE